MVVSSRLRQMVGKGKIVLSKKVSTETPPPSPSRKTLCVMKNNMKKIGLLFVIGIFSTSCATLIKNSANEKYCGYEMTFEEINEISTWSYRYPNVYDVKSGTEIYEEINDSIRNNMPDTIVFELFLIKLTKDEVGIDAYVPNNKQFIEDVACIFMNTKFSCLIPKNRKIRIYSYTNPDGSGDSQFEAGLKNNTHAHSKQ